MNNRLCITHKNTYIETMELTAEIHLLVKSKAVSLNDGKRFGTFQRSQDDANLAFMRADSENYNHKLYILL